MPPLTAAKDPTVPGGVGASIQQAADAVRAAEAARGVSRTPAPVSPAATAAASTASSPAWTPPPMTLTPTAAAKPEAPAGFLPSTVSSTPVPKPVAEDKAWLPPTFSLKPDFDLYKPKDAAPDPSEEYGGVVAPYQTPEQAKKPAAVATEAKTLVAAPPAQVGEVIEKLKAEEAKGGPGFWDVIQAAAAGWGGQVPLYVQKELAKKEQEAQMAQAREMLALESGQRATEEAARQAFERGQLRESIAAQERLAQIQRGGGIPSVTTPSGLSLSDVALGG